MSQENVDLVREVHAGWARGDFGFGGDRLALDFEWHQFPQAVDGVQLDNSVALVRTLRDGKLARTEFSARREALEAAGLRE